jgi:outer membrane receptor protein involved in Fe transport
MRLPSRLSAWAMPVTVLCTLVAMTGAVPGVSLAQELAQAGQRPRFLLAVGGRTEPVEVSAAAVPLLIRRVTLAVEDAPIATVLEAISRQTGIRFVYAADTVPADRRLTLKVENITLAAALTEVLLDTGLDVLASTDRRLTLVPRSGARVAMGTIVGRVTDAKTQTALAGATVAVEGTRHSATTSNDGRYRIADVAPGTYTVRARYIGYTPGTASVTVSADQEVTADVALERSVQRLDEVVTTGTVAETQIKALPTPITVITGKEIAEKNIQHVDQLFRGDVPGMYAWDTGPNNIATRFASIRGSTSIAFTDNNPKVYVDGIEMAEESFLAALDPASIERMEVVRGPQSSTLYGSQALNGVIQIFTKKGKSGLAGPQVEAKAAAGLVQSEFVDKSVAAQHYGLEVTGGSEHASYHLGGTYRKVGQYVAEMNSEQYGSAFVGARVVNGPLSADFSGRYAIQTIGSPILPFFPRTVPLLHNLTIKRPHETYAATVTFRALPQWDHTLVVGFDRSSNAYVSPLRLSTPTDSLGFVSTFDENRVSLGYHTTLTTHLGSAVSAAWTLGIDHWAFEGNSASISETPTTTGSLVIPPTAFVNLGRFSFTNTGYYGQLQAGVHDAVFLTGGLRGERNDNFGADAGTYWAPRVGVSAVQEVGGLSAKVRASYGKAIRPPGAGTATAAVFPGFIQLANPTLKSEEQVGFDAGLELYLGRSISVQVTYYHQTANNLIDLEQLAFDPATFTGTYQNVNLGRVKNTGWEFQASVTPVAPLTLSGTLSIARSTVDSLGPGYGGSYQVGDQILQVPHTSGGVTATYALPRTTFSAGVTYANSWVNLDQVRYYDDLYVKQVFTNPYRSYWVTYPAFARVRLSASHQLTPWLNVFAQVENLTNRQLGEVDNFNISAGRTTTIGVRVRS